MSNERYPLDVWLGDDLVGRLALRSDKAGRCDFTFHPTYTETYPRPVLGQAFEDDPRGTYFNHIRLPAFFANLLPEGALRAMLERQVHGRGRHEIHMIAAVGADLPGAVRVTASEGGPPDFNEISHENRERDVDSPALRFALSGVQLKMSVLKETGGGLVVPAYGLGGNWIVKFPYVGLDGLPENEHAMMTWAGLSGLDVPRADLVSMATIEGLAPRFRELGETAYAVERFDRIAGGGRVHMEDFAQVFGRYPDEKYSDMSHERMAELVALVVGGQGLDELLRRYLFMVAIGNGDAHMKNWSLLYRDAVTPTLSPAYDLVSTLSYPKLDDCLALPLHRSTAWSDVTMTSFERLADACVVSRAPVRELVEATIDHIAVAAPLARERTRFPAGGWAKIAEHWQRLPLFKGRACWT